MENVSDASNDNGSFLTEFLFLGGLVLAAAVAAKKWFYPYTIIDLETRVKDIDTLIKNNTSLEWSILENSAPGFRRTLGRLHNEVQLIKTKTNAEPDRTKVVSWVGFQLSQLQETKTCYLKLRALQLEVTSEVEERKRRLRSNDITSPAVQRP
ncbi:hypothetical protein L218DRAFT_1003021 [Marasmius fiardii PR-910]|nr:hypothetical protein L218DRAFT_1003021 [Marasmius fiardii PR-910]